MAGVLDVHEIVWASYSVADTAGIATVRATDINLPPESVDSAASIRCACERGLVDAEAKKFVDASTVECLGAAFLPYGPVYTEVRISVGGKAYTNSSLPYKLHSATCNTSTLAFGPSVRHGGATGVKPIFAIQALDSTGTPRDTGGDQYRAMAVCDSDRPKTKKEAAAMTKITDVEVVDQKNGTPYIVPKKDSYKTHVGSLGTLEGEADPVHAILETDSAPENNTLEGLLVTSHIRDKTSTMKDFCSQSISAGSTKSLRRVTSRR
jgi:hypothetical protein